MKSLPIKKSVLIIIIAAVCVAVYIIIFHVPHPVLFDEETILSSGGGTYEIVDEKDNLERSYEYEVGEIFVICGDDDAYAVINVDDLTEILKSTFCLFEYNNPPYSVDDRIYEIGVVTNNGVMHIIIGKEDTFWYRSGDDVYKHQMLDSEVFQQRISDALTFY